jgi:hypothetical protein
MKPAEQRPPPLKDSYLSEAAKFAAIVSELNDADRARLIRLMEGLVQEQEHLLRPLAARLGSVRTAAGVRHLLDDFTSH